MEDNLNKVGEGGGRRQGESRGKRDRREAEEKKMKNGHFSSHR